MILLQKYYQWAPVSICWKSSGLPWSPILHVPFFIKQVEELIVFSNKIFDFTNASMNLIWLLSKEPHLFINSNYMFKVASNFQMKPRILGISYWKLNKNSWFRMPFIFIFIFSSQMVHDFHACSVICCVFLFFLAILFGNFLSLFLALNSSYFFKSCIMKSSWNWNVLIHNEWLVLLIT